MFEVAGEWFSKYEDRSIEIVQSEEYEEKRMKKN